MSMKKKLDKALEGVLVPQEVYLPPALLNRKEVVTSWEGLNKYTPPTIEQQRIRINVECDPVGQLMAIANGLPVASFVVEDAPHAAFGQEPVVKIKYETATLAQRIKLLEAMRDKVVPNLSMNQGPPTPKVTDDEAQWEQLTRGRSAQVLAGESD